MTEGIQKNAALGKPRVKHISQRVPWKPKN